MRTVLGTRLLEIPEDVDVKIKSRTVSVTGPRGTLERSFKHVNLDLVVVNPRTLRVDLWFGTRKQTASDRVTKMP